MRFSCIIPAFCGRSLQVLLGHPALQVPVKERAGHFVMTYHMDVRTEPVETIQLQPGKYSVMRPAERLDLHELPVQEKNGRVLAGAWR